MDRAERPMIKKLSGFTRTAGDGTMLLDYAWVVGRCIRTTAPFLVDSYHFGRGIFSEDPVSPSVDGWLHAAPSFFNPGVTSLDDESLDFRYGTEWVGYIDVGTEFAIQQIFFVTHFPEGRKWHLVAPIRLASGEVVDAEVSDALGSAATDGGLGLGPVASMREGKEFLRDTVEWCEPLDPFELPLPEEE